MVQLLVAASETDAYSSRTHAKTAAQITLPSSRGDHADTKSGTYEWCDANIDTFVESG
jgi:hypothetical protein